MALIPNTLFVGKVCIKLDRVHSTQTYLAELCAKSKPFDGTAVLSYNQTDGYGQRQREWHSGEGLNIALSVYFNRITVPSAHQFLLSMAMALAAKTAVATTIGDGVSIKWPNDIMVGNKKISGLLIETHIRNHKISQAIVGVGVNVNQRFFPADLGLATSLMLETQKEFDLDGVAIHLLECMEQQYLRLNANPQDLVNAYNLSLFKRGKVVSLQYPSGELTNALLEGVNAQGLLMVKVQDKSLTFQTGQVRLLYDS